ncbi:hypothetical protein BC937DRAFT_92468 [Endogone sp. FLAS-F59071]|nr:hypothetical protein BC937DRAFT_92468 [Endogone sp. FLAS-F59071]|eukprot:RUS21499.1 hypothetical protein BC937DRAFT_92468 [Endogone sp. FLAS-F59071]
MRLVAQLGNFLMTHVWRGNCALIFITDHHLHTVQVRHESRQLMFGFFVGLVIGVAYFTFKLYRIYDPSQAQKYVFTKDFLTVFGKSEFLSKDPISLLDDPFNFLDFVFQLFAAAISLLLLLVTTINGIICFMNFDKGLKSHLLRDAAPTEGSQSVPDRILVLD